VVHSGVMIAAERTRTALNPERLFPTAPYQKGVQVVQRCLRGCSAQIACIDCVCGVDNYLKINRFIGSFGVVLNESSAIEAGGSCAANAVGALLQAHCGGFPALQLV
jgi:hypothetical protein